MFTFYSHRSVTNSQGVCLSSWMVLSQWQYCECKLFYCIPPLMLRMRLDRQQVHFSKVCSEQTRNWTQFTSFSGIRFTHCTRCTGLKICEFIYFSHWWQIRQKSWWFEIIGISVFHPMGHTACGKCFQLLSNLEKNISLNENTIVS